jgi:hypothetical protein
MSTYILQAEFLLPHLPFRKVPNRLVGLYGSLNSGCYLKKSWHFGGVLGIETFCRRGDGFKFETRLPSFQLIRFET